jgi:predicted dinucleotide-binding enzyme
MSVKKTIAIVGAENKNGIEIANRLAAGNYRLLLLSNQNHPFSKVYKNIKALTPDTEIELIDCVKDGCWEADIIIIAVGDENINEVVEKIREVAIQKIVAFFLNTTKAESSIQGDLQQLLPYSKVAEVLKSSNAMDIFISSDDDEALQTISTMLSLAGYHSIITGSFPGNKQLQPFIKN